jgi:hypothetical protein
MDMPTIHGGAFSGVSQALGGAKKAPSKPAAPAAHEHSDAPYSLAHDASATKAGLDTV